MRKPVFLLLLLLLSFALDATEIITLSQAKELAITNNPHLKKAVSELKSAQNARLESFLALGPSASLNYNKILFNPEPSPGLEETSAFSINASQPIFNGGKIFLSSQITDNAFRIKKEAWRGKLLEIITNTEIKYHSVQSNAARVKALEKSLLQSSVNLEIAQAKFTAGIISNTSLLQMQSEKLASELNLLNLQNAYELAKLEFADYIGISGDFDIEEFSSDSLEPLLSLLSDISPLQQQSLEKKLLLQGEKSNPNLQIALLGIDNASKAKLMAAGSVLPSLNLSYSYDWESSNLTDDYTGSSTLALVASIPIFPLADNAFAYQAARYDQKSSEADLTATSNSVLLAIRSSFLNLLTSAKAVASAQLSSEFAWNTATQMQQNFAQGLLSANDLISMEVLVINADVNLIAARQNLLESASALQQLLGLDNQDLLINLLKNTEE